MVALQQKIIFRELVVNSLRQFLAQNGYHEVDAPTIVPSLIPESYLDVFETTLSDAQKNSYGAYLTASPEAFLKRLLVEGSSDIFYLGKAYRNGEPLNSLHNHEFTILEWYKLENGYQKLMAEIEQMIYTVAQTAHAQDLLKNLAYYAPPWEYKTIKEMYRLFVPKTETSINPYDEKTAELFEKYYVQYIEPNAGVRGKPTFIIDFPSWQSPLAQTNSLNPQSAQRFELYIHGVEIINGWTELTDWRKQHDNFKHEQQERKQRGKNPYPADNGFIEALKKGMPSCAGAAMGVERLIMALGGYKKLKDVILFPTAELFQKR